MFILYHITENNTIIRFYDIIRKIFLTSKRVRKFYFLLYFKSGLHLVK